MCTLAEDIITVTPNSDRALPAETLAQNLENYCKNVSISDTIVNAVEKVLRLLQRTE